MANGSCMPIQGYALLVRMEVLNEEWARRNHDGQSLARLAERGGLSICEAAAIVERRPWKMISDMEAFTILRSARPAKWNGISGNEAQVILNSLKK